MNLPQRDYTAESAEAFLRRQSLWRRLTGMFQERTPDDTELTLVSTMAEVAIDKVFSTRNLSLSDQDELHSTVKDYAECGTLYGYMLGYAAGLQAARETAA